MQPVLEALRPGTGNHLPLVDALQSVRVRQRLGVDVSTLSASSLCSGRAAI